MQAHCGFHTAEIDACADMRYVFRFPDGREFSDPASRFQPDGVHGASAVVDTRAFRWTDRAFVARPLAESVIYELHVGTFTREGTFATAIERLDSLADLGITAVEIMPVAQFPGSRNWGYDGVYPFAVQNSYGGPTGLQQFVDAAHARGISVILDVVYNHLGPEGNYLGAFAPFFSDRYHTPWGEAVNFDGPRSEPVRAFFIQNALYWLDQLHIDGLRLDAVHGIYDFSANHILAELRERVNELARRTGRRLTVIAESDLNDARLLHSADRDGYALDAQWSDDFHHGVHTLLTRETSGYYADFGKLEDLAQVLRAGWLYAGQYSRYRRRRHGNSPEGVPFDHFVVFIQNHDQVGNRAEGERLAQLVDLEGLKLAAGVMLLSPFVPLLFMGEEYGETHPFLYFTSHSDRDLIEAVRKGRQEEFASFGWRGEVPDPQAESTFERSRLDYEARQAEPGRDLWTLYKTLIALRKHYSLGGATPEVRCDNEQQTITLEYSTPKGPLLAAFNFANEPARIPLNSAHAPLAVIVNSSERAYVANSPYEPASAPDGKFAFGRRSFAVFAPATGEKQ